MDQIINLFERKGWALYKVTKDSSGNLGKIVLNGKASRIEQNNYYHILPIASNSEDINEIIDHIEIAQKTKQLPTYVGGGKEKFNLDGIEFRTDSIYLHPAHTTDFQVKVNYSNIQRTIQYGISNYNTYFFDSIDELIEKVGLSPQQETILPKQMRWEFVHKDNSDLNILLPSNPNPIFFRGQNKRYQPCYPTVSRNITTHSLTLQNLTPEEQISIIVNLVKSKWFGDLLEETPQFQWYKEQNIWIDKLALAQHYELPTGLIDLTQSIDVASFFACCKYENDSWAPMKSGEGVIYMLDWRLMPIENRKIRAIGQQAFPRPSEQWGWTYEMNLNEDFDLLPFVKKCIFLHNEESSTKVLNKFSYGKDLFPDDPLFILADKIKKSKELPSQIMNNILDDLLNDEKGLKGCSKNEIVRSISKQFAILSEIRLLDESIKSKMQALWDSQKDDFMNKIGGVGFRVVRTIKNRS